jgi:putative peptide zinc metalloprotease protein
MRTPRETFELGTDGASRPSPAGAHEVVTHEVVTHAWAKPRRIELSAPSRDRPYGVVHNPQTGSYTRLGEAAYVRYASMPETVSAADISATSGGAAASFVERLVDAGLLVPADESPPSTVHRRLRMRGPFHIELSLWTDRLGRSGPHRFLRAFPTRAAGWLGVVLLASGVPAYFAVRAAMSGLVAPPAPSAVWGAVAAIYPSIVLHELGHALALAAFGRRVRRAGVMLFFFCPALFVDVSDAWMLPKRHQRARVALAGIFVNCVLAVASMWTLVLLPAEFAQLRWFLLFFAFNNVVISVFNLNPFVKLDGYWALTAAIDLPNLRERARFALDVFVRSLANGDARERRFGPLHAYALAGMVVPVFVALSGLAYLHGPLMVLGRPGALVWLTVAALGIAWTGVHALSYVGELIGSALAGKRVFVAVAIVALLGVSVVALRPVASWFYNEAAGPALSAVVE